MGLGVWFAQDLQHVIAGLNDAATGLTQVRGVGDAREAAYLTGYRDALRALSTSLGLTAPRPAAPFTLEAKPAIAHALTVGQLDEVLI